MPKIFEKIEKKDTSAIQGQCWRIFDAIDDYVTIFDLDKRIISANHSLLGGFQVELSRIANCKCYEALWGRDENCRICPVEKVLHDLKTHTIEV